MESAEKTGSLCCTLKLTQHCKATVFQFKKKQESQSDWCSQSTTGHHSPWMVWEGIFNTQLLPSASLSGPLDYEACG